MKPGLIQWSDLRGYSRLVVQATLGVTDLVEAQHHTILRLPGPMQRQVGTPRLWPHRAVESTLRTTSALVYGSVRGITRLAGGALDLALRPLPTSASGAGGAERAALLSALNGVLGDRLVADHNPLAIRMGWYHEGQPLGLTPKTLAQAFPNVGPRLLVMLHGHCMSELQWERKGQHLGRALAAAHGLSPVYLRYNTGLHISANGRTLASQLQALVDAWPVAISDITLVGYSMGGLLARSALHCAQQAGCTWPQRVRRVLFVGTPHHGSMVERSGNRIDSTLALSPYSRAFARLGQVRSAGTTDLRFGNLLDADWQQRDRFAPGPDPRHPLPLPRHIKSYAIAAQWAEQPAARQARWVGDGLVPVPSALGHHPNPAHDLGIPPPQQRVVTGTSHLGLLDSAAVRAQLIAWTAATDPK